MKKIIVFFCCIMLFACKSQQTTLSPFVSIYKREGSPNIFPEYISLKTRPKIYELYSPGIYLCIVGEWNINNDTLFLLPKYKYHSTTHGLKFSEITPKDSTILTIPQQYLIKNDSLIDITDYSAIFSGYLEMFYDPNFHEVYERVTKP